MEWPIAVISTVEKEIEEKLTILKACLYLLVKVSVFISAPQLKWHK